MRRLAGAGQGGPLAGARPKGQSFGGGVLRFAASLLMCCALIAAFGGDVAQAHTAFSGSSPNDGETLSAPPEQLHLTFSGKLEGALHAVKLTGPDGVAAPLEPLVLSDDRKMIMADLPELANGKYTVAFRVISGDGHPMEGTISFEVAVPEPASEPAPAPAEEPGQGAAAGPGTEQEPDAPPPESGVGEGASSPPDGTVSESPDTSPSSPQPDNHVHVSPYAAPGFLTLLFVSRVLYYAALLALLGWALWSALQRLTERRAAYWRNIGMRLLTVHLLAFGLFAMLHWLELTAGGQSGVPFAALLRDTGVGQSWLFTGVLAVAGFPLLFRYRYVDAGWAVLIIAAKTLRGHASAFEPVLWARIADGVHLASAAVWAGGLLALVLVMRTSADWFRSLAPSFSTAALAALLVLAATGVVSAVLYTERLTDLPETAWGMLLLGKIALVAVVVPVAALLRRYLRKGDAASFRKWIRVDFALLFGIVAVTGILTHVSPTMERMAFNWHVMGSEVHLSADIAELRGGANELSLKVWVPAGDGPPAVSAFVTEPGSPETAVALSAVDIPSEEWETFGDFDKYTFAGAPAIRDPKAASLRVIVQRSNGQQYEYTKRLAGT